VTVASDTRPSGGSFRRFVIAVLVVGFALCLYFGFFALVGYTDDAYIRSDVIRIAPEVSGPITVVHFRDNDHVESGATLLTIDPEPFQLAVQAKRDRVDSARAVVALKTEARASQTANIEAAQAALDLAQADTKRVEDLAARGFAAQQELDKANDTLRSSQSALAYAKAQLIVADREVDAMQRDVKTAETDLAIAQYNLSRTELKAGSAGYLNNFNISPGRYAAAGEPLIGVIDDKSWRVIANFKEDVAASVAPGKEVWVWLDTHPWRLYRGHVQSVARGIARNETPEQLLPYVAPTTDWVRLRRRFPVTIILDPPAPRDALYMGADARVWFWR
jgi:membrane fusion protein, multidrug efflux system